MLFVLTRQLFFPKAGRIRPRRRHDLRHPAFALSRSLVAAARHLLGGRQRYTPTTTFETFPFPEGLTPNIPAADYADDPRAQRIAAAAKKLDDLRRAWLNPPDLVDIVPEVTPTAAPGEAPRRYPDRIVPKTVEAAASSRSAR